VEITGPQVAKKIAPSAADGAETLARRKRKAPRAATGNGRATHRLKPTISVPSMRSASTGSRNSWFKASAAADCPAPRYGSQNGNCPANRLLRIQR